MIKRDPFWIDFDTAIASKGQLEQNEAEEKALEESKHENKRHSKPSSTRKGDTRTLKDKLDGAMTIHDLIAQQKPNKSIHIPGEIKK